jgi:AsmA protein
MKLKKLLKIIGGALVTLVLLLLAIPLFISAETLKKEFTAQATKATGRTVDIKGKASLKLFPNIEVSLEDVTIGNPAGFKSPYLIHAKTLATGASLKPLLAGNLNVTGITLHGADIQLEQTSAGAKNWEFAKAKEAAPTTEKKGKASDAIKSFALGDVSIKDSAVKYITPQGPKVLDKINLTVKGADARGAFSVDGSLNYQGKSVKLKAELTKLRDFLAQKISPAALALDLPGGKVKFDGKLQMDKEIAAAGNISLALSDVPNLVGWATGKAGKGLPKSVDLKGVTSIKGKKLSLKDATLKVDALTATSDLAANMEGSVPAISGTLKFGTLDLNTFIKTASVQSHGFMDAHAAAPKGWSAEPIDLSGLRAVNANLNISAAKLLQGKLEISDIAIHPQLSGGNLNLAINKASLYGGTAVGTITASAGAQSVGADLDFTGIQIEPFLMALKGDTRLSGTAAMKLNVKGSGSSQQAIVSNLNGNGAIKITDGSIKGMNLAQFWRDMKHGFLFDNPSQSTDFSELSGTYTITQGVVSNSDLAMKSPALRLSGKGTVNLPQRTVNYRLVPSVVTTLKGQGGKDASGLDIPIDISGSIDNPSVTPDLAGMVQKQLANPEELKKTIKNVGESVKDFNSVDDIGRALLGGKKEPVAQPAPAPAANTVPAPAAPASAPAVQPAPTKEEQIMQGVGGLLKGF